MHLRACGWRGCVVWVFRVYFGGDDPGTPPGPRTWHADPVVWSTAHDQVCVRTKSREAWLHSCKLYQELRPMARWSKSCTPTAVVCPATPTHVSIGVRDLAGSLDTLLCSAHVHMLVVNALRNRSCIMRINRRMTLVCQAHHLILKQILMCRMRPPSVSIIIILYTLVSNRRYCLVWVSKSVDLPCYIPSPQQDYRSAPLFFHR